MKKMILTAVFATLSPLTAAHATVGPALIDAINDKDALKIERMIEAKARQEIATPMINDFKVDWDSNENQCIEAKTEMDESYVAGVCTLRFHGIQVAGTVALIIRNGKYSVSILQVDLE